MRPTLAMTMRVFIGPRPAVLAAVGAALLAVMALPCLAGSSGFTNLDLPTSVKVLNYDLVAENANSLPRAVPDIWTDKKVASKLRDVKMDVTADATESTEVDHEKRRQPYRHFMPSLSGATGLIDMPIAYTVPKRKWVVSAQTEHVAASEAYWRGPYLRQDQSNRYFSLNYGATRNIEVNADVEFWDRDFRYYDPIGATDPTFHSSDKFHLGFGSKWAFPLPGMSIERVWFATGFRFQFYENAERNVIDFHEYERFQNIYFVFSTKGTEQLFGHLMFKYISYDWRGGVPPSGETTDFFGYSPINAWGQWGIAFEWFVFPDLEIFTEFHKDTNVVFLDNLLQFNWNAGIRYQYKDFGVGFWAKRINFPGLDHNGIQASWKF